MRVIEARNPHQALPMALELLRKHGVQRQSRNGPVLVAPWPVATVYSHPCERVVFHAARDCNPFLHLYESLWMLAGREDVAPLERYTKKFRDYSDDGVTLHGAYGHRWRHWPLYSGGQRDQLELIATSLRANHDDRRCVLSMWNAARDLGRNGKDVPCNVTATFQVSVTGALDMAVFCRSNDIIWGAYGANAVHFSFLQEFMALRVGVPVGVYTQISVNWHAYLEPLEKLKTLSWNLRSPTDRSGYDNRIDPPIPRHVPIPESLDSRLICNLVRSVDENQFTTLRGVSEWSNVVLLVLEAHHLWKTTPKSERYAVVTKFLDERTVDSLYQPDWVVAAREWFGRRAAQ